MHIALLSGFFFTPTQEPKHEYKLCKVDFLIEQKLTVKDVKGRYLRSYSLSFIHSLILFLLLLFCWLPFEYLKLIQIMTEHYFVV